MTKERLAEKLINQFNDLATTLPKMNDLSTEEAEWVMEKVNKSLEKLEKVSEELGTNLLPG